MSKTFLKFFFFCFIFAVGCSEDNNTVTPNPNTGEVLLASVSGDSVGTTSGFSSRSMSITSGALNFSDRDSARISFYYTGESNIIAAPMNILYNDSLSFYSFTLTPTLTEQFINVTVPSNRLNAFFKYEISTSSAPGSSFFKFRDMKIYKK